jgi:hypothetical protein
VFSFLLYEETGYLRALYYTFFAPPCQRRRILVTVKRLQGGKEAVATKAQRHEAGTKPRVVFATRGFALAKLCASSCLIGLFVSSGLGGARFCPCSAVTQC